MVSVPIIRYFTLKHYICVMERRNFLISSDQQFMGVAEYAAQPNPFSRKLNSRIHRLAKNTISPRVLNHWIASGLIQDNRASLGSHHRFSLSDFVWIRILLSLRSFGCSLKTLRLVKESLELGKRPLCERPVLEFHIALSLRGTSPSLLIVFSNGEALIGTKEEIDIATQTGSVKDDYIAIDIGRLSKTQLDLSGSLYNDLEQVFEALQDNLERAISSALNNPKIKKVTIESREAKYVLKATHLMENRNAALAAKQLHDFCTLEETVHKGRSKFNLTTSKHIKKQ